MFRKKWWLQEKADEGSGGSGATEPAAPDTGDGKPAPAGDNSAGSSDPGTGDTPTGDASDKATKPNDDPWGGLREKYAAGDAKKAQRLGRYATPEAAFDALLSLQSKIGSGELRSALPKDATPEQVKAWRTENGIPESIDGYEISTKIPEGDQEMAKSFLESMHKANANNAVASEALNWYYKEVERVSNERKQKDVEFASQSEEALRAEWQGEYKMNMNMVNGLLETMPTDVREEFKLGRLANGDPILANPATLKWLNSLSRQINPVTTIVPNAGANIASAIDDEISAIEKLMQTDRKAYNEDEKKQSRLRELYEARDKLKG